MSFLWRFVAWGAPAFLIAWLIQAPYEHWIGGLAAGLAAPRGAQIEILDLELFFPFDLGVFVALCLASSWAPRASRWKAIALGLPVLIVVEILVLFFSFKILMATGSSEYALRLVNGICRLEGLMAAAIVWGSFLARGPLLLQGSSRLFSIRRPGPLA